VLALDAKDEAGDPIDISAWTVRFECDGVPLSVLCTPDASTPHGLMLILTRTHISALKRGWMQYSMVKENELGAGLPFVLREGRIKRVGYVNEPDEIDEGGTA
jgi:hypothetical protein